MGIRSKYDAPFKTKVVMEALKEQETLASLLVSGGVLSGEYQTPELILLDEPDDEKTRSVGYDGHWNTPYGHIKGHVENAHLDSHYEPVY